MAFGPFKYIFRHSGAFFLRRSFRGNALYALVLARYIKTLLSEGLPIEFFIEGGRSRTGKMIMPQYGLLSMIIQACQEKAVDDLALIPVYVGYDRVIEEKTYLQELGGRQKTQESTIDIVRSSRILRRRYGRVYVNIGEPIYLRDYLDAQPIPVSNMPVEERQRLYRKIGYEVVTAINRVSVVTPLPSSQPPFSPMIAAGSPTRSCARSSSAFTIISSTERRISPSRLPIGSGLWPTPSRSWNGKVLSLP